MRLIDADELLKQFGEIKEGSQKIYIQSEIAEIINSQPTVEQKHGHFIEGEFISTLGICSVCEHPIDDGDNYCKWCGAKMDEVTEDV